VSFKVANLDSIWNNAPILAEALQSLRDGIDTIGQKLSVNPQGPTIAPTPPQALNVVASGGITHVTITDNSPRTRHVNYFVEYDTSPNFSNAHPLHLGIGRSARIPTFMGPTPIYVRAYAMYPDGPRSTLIYHGSPISPTPILDGAPTVGPSLPPTPGSGTSTHAGYGYGRDKFVSPPRTPGKPPKVY